MNLSNWSHALLAVFVQAVIAVLAHAFGASWTWAFLVGAVFPIGFYFGREVAQHERKAGTPPWWSGFRIWQWSQDALWDFFLPTIWVLVVAINVLVWSLS